MKYAFKKDNMTKYAFKREYMTKYAFIGDICQNMTYESGVIQKDFV